MSAVIVVYFEILFIIINGADTEAAYQMLEVCHGNLDEAIGMHLDEKLNVSVTSTCSSTASITSSMTGGNNTSKCSPTTASDQFGVMNCVRAPIPQRHEVLVEEDASNHSNYRHYSARSIFDGFRDFREEARIQESAFQRDGVTYSKKQSLEDLFRPPIDITCKGTLNFACLQGVEQGRWILVNVQNAQEFACQVLNRDVWSHIPIKQIIQSNFVFWQVYHDSDEGKRYSQFYKIDAMPYTAIIDPVTGENLATWNINDTAMFKTILQEFLSLHPSPRQQEAPPSRKHKPMESIIDATEDEQIEAAIRASLVSIPEHCHLSCAVVSACTSINADVSWSDSNDLHTFFESDDGSQQQELLPRAFHSSATQRPNRVNTSSGNHPTNSLCCHRYGKKTVDLSITSNHCDFTHAACPASTSTAHTVGTVLPCLCSSGHTQPPPSDTVVTSVVQSCDCVNKMPLTCQSTYNPILNICQITSCCCSSELLDSSASSFDNKEAISSSPSDTSCNVIGTGDFADQRRKAASNSCGSVIQLIIRFPNGNKDHVTLPSSSKLEELEQYCSVKGFNADSYELVTNFPCRSLSTGDMSTTLQQAKLHHQETIFVQAR